MPFANLPTHEKDAFFALLDEYFASRPDLLARGASEDAEAQSSIPAAPAAAAAFTAAQRALANPATSRAFAAGIQRAGTAVSGNTSSPPPAPPPRSVSSEAVDNDSAPPASAAFSAAQRALANPATSRAFAAGIQRASTAASGNTSSTASPPPAPPPRSASSAAVDDDSAPPVTYGRVAAAAQAFSAAAAAPTPPPPRAANPPTHKRTDSASGLVTQKKFGDVDVSSAGGMFRSLRGSTAAKNAPPAPMRTPPAFAARKASNLPPPPVRRVSVSPAAPVPEPEPEPEEAEEEEVGKWAEVLYDYTSQDAGDLDIREGDRVLVTEWTSSDWWTGEIDGRSGLFPATYAKLL